MEGLVRVVDVSFRLLAVPASDAIPRPVDRPLAKCKALTANFRCLAPQLLDEVQNVTVQIAYSELACSIKRVVDVFDEINPISRPRDRGFDLARLEKLV